MNKNRKTLKMPVRYLMNAVLVVLLFLALSYMTGNMLSTYQNKVLMTVGINIILAVSLNVATGYLGVGCTNVPNDSLHSAPFCQMIAAFAVSAAASPESVKNSALSPRRTRETSEVSESQ